MYASTLLVHSWLRWAVLALGVWAVVRAFSGVSGQRPWSAADAAAGRWFSTALDAQLLLGIALYGFLSPITTQAFGDMGAAMRNATLRFWAVEHLAMMIAAVALVHVGRVRSRRVPADQSKHLNAAIFFTMAMLAILTSIPWPFMSVGRPLLRF
jgi:hypothetical protein